MTTQEFQVTGLDSVKSLSSIPAGATSVWLQAETQSIRYSTDGTDPSSSHGLILVVGNDPVLYSGNISALKFLEVTASAILNGRYVIDRTTA